MATVAIPDHLVPLAQQLADLHAAECHHQALMIERTFGAGHPHHSKARAVYSEALALQHVFEPAKQVAA